MNTIVQLHKNGAEIKDPYSMPHSVEAEQQLLGAIFARNENYDRVSSILEPEHFYDPIHAEIYEISKSRIQQNKLVNPTTLAPFFSSHDGLAELGGPAYFTRLLGASIGTFAVAEYARFIRDLAIRRKLIELGTDIGAKARSFEPTIEPDDQITDAEQQLYALAEQGQADQGFQSFLKAVTSAVSAAADAFKRDGALAGISTGLVDLDKILGGLHRSDLLILAGRPSMGKTSLATNIAFNIAKAYKKGEVDGVEKAVNGGVVGFFSLEMSAEQLAARILSDAAELSSHNIRNGDFTEPEFRRVMEAAKTLEACPLYIDDTPALPISQLAARARRLKRTQGLDVIVVDYLQLLRPATAKDSRVNEVSEITQGLKAIAKELDIPVIALSQLSRQVENREDKRPQLSDLRESGSIEQDADVVMFVYREEYYAAREEPSPDRMDDVAKWQERMERVRGMAEVVIGKQRHGPIGTVNLSFIGEFTRFGNLVKPWQQDSTSSGDTEF